MTLPSTPLMSALPKPTLNLDFSRAENFPGRLSFTRAGTLTYRDAVGTTKTAQANSPRIGRHPSNDNLRSGLVLAATETAQYATSGWLASQSGTMLWVGSLASLAVSSMLWGINDGTSSNYIRVRIDSATVGRLRLQTNFAGAVTTSDLQNPLLVDTRYAVAVSWTSSLVLGVINDTNQVAAALTGMSTGFTNLSVGSVVTGLSGAVMDGVIERMRYWPTAMNLQQLRALTRI